MADPRLTPRQARFVQEYLIDLNGAAAYVRAGYRARGNSAEASASRLLRIGKVASAIERAIAERAERSGITADRVLDELAAIGFARLGDYVDWDADHIALRPSAEIDSRALLSVKVTRKVLSSTEDGDVLSEERSIKLLDKLSALKLLGQHVGLFADKLDVTIDLGAEAARIAREHGLPPEMAGKIVSMAEHLKKGRTA